MHTGKAFFGTNDMSFDVVRPIVPSVPNVTRHYEQFTAVVDDTIDARVFQGLHFRSADVQGARIGRDVARLAVDAVPPPCADSAQEIAQRIVRVMASPAPRTTVASAIGSHGSRSGQRAQRGRSDTAAPAISR